MGKLHNHTEGERQRIEAFRMAPPAVREYILQALETIREDMDDEGIREFCRRLTRAMRRER